MLTRRDFLKLSGLCLGGLAFPARPFDYGSPDGELDPLQPFPLQARVTIDGIYAYAEPNFKSERLEYHRRDKILYLRSALKSPHGPPRNPTWYRLENGYAHSAYLQRVEDRRSNAVLPWIPESGILGQITTPFTRSYRLSRSGEWSELYRLYYGSVHWITGILDGPDSAPWYTLTDDLLHVDYCVPARHVAPIPQEAITPLAAHIAPQEKRIAVSLSEQRLTAYEGERIVLAAPISSGVKTDGPSPNGIPTTTPMGNFHIEVKTPSRHMGDGNLTSDLDAYELPGVPWVSFFHQDGIALHGTYWHDNFGSKMSHGCINLRMQDALFIYRWSDPQAMPWEWNSKGHGTLVQITE